jgi:hypothetical protein
MPSFYASGHIWRRPRQVHAYLMQASACELFELLLLCYLRLARRRTLLYSAVDSGRPASHLEAMPFRPTQPTTAFGDATLKRASLCQVSPTLVTWT